VKVFRKPVKQMPRKRLRAAAQRAAKYAEEDYASEEPNVRLSRAFVVVLLLHIVAVGGIFAFSALKDRQATGSAGKPDRAEPASGKVATAQPVGVRESGMTEKSGSKSEAQKIIDSSRQAIGSGAKAQGGGALESSGEGGKTYVVQKGDSPAGIAKKFKVSYAELLKTNNIEDPKKLQIGQRLLIP
jgi:nucleoid-associated protein YgaU